VPITVRNGTHRLVVEGLVQNKMRALVTTNASDISDYASYLPIYHNESYLHFDPKYVSMFVVMDYPTYTVPSSGRLQCNWCPVIKCCWFCSLCFLYFV